MIGSEWFRVHLLNNLFSLYRINDTQAPSFDVACNYYTTIINLYEATSKLNDLFTQYKTLISPDRQK